MHELCELNILTFGKSKMKWRKRKLKIFVIGASLLMIYLFIFISTNLIATFKARAENLSDNHELYKSDNSSASIVLRDSEDLLKIFNYRKNFPPLHLLSNIINDLSDNIKKQDKNSENDFDVRFVPKMLDTDSIKPPDRARITAGSQQGQQPDIGRVNEIKDRLQNDDNDAIEISLNKSKKVQNNASIYKSENTRSSSQKIQDDIQTKIVITKPNDVDRTVTPVHAIKNEEETVQDDCVEVSKNTTYEDVTFPVFVEYGKPGDPGENGEETLFGVNELTAADKEKKNKDFENHYFDEWVSRKIAIHRSLSDHRPLQCKDQNVDILPAVSVLIVFYNEAWTTLLRSIHSILDRTPDHLLKEIVLLDDYSDMDHLKKPLEAYVQKYAKVRLFRSNTRLGLIRARNLVFEHSSGDIVVFLDSHIECFPGWLEPLLGPIHANYKTVTFPTIEYLNPLSFRVIMSPVPTNVGGLNLNRLVFSWLYSRSKVGRTTFDNAPSPTMPGGLYAISRRFFSELGKYDPGMELWGGENLEISFKVWMCDGSVLLVPCSHIGHIFRGKNPALRGRSGFGFKNNIRVAEVWMDHYKHFFYEKISYNIPSFGDVSSRLQLRKSLQCHDFAWYLQNVYPELNAFINKHSNYVGQIRNVITNLCVDKGTQSYVSVSHCGLFNSYQQWTLGINGTIWSIDVNIGVEIKRKDGKVVGRRLGIFNSGSSKNNVYSMWTYNEDS